MRADRLHQQAQDLAVDERKNVDQRQNSDGVPRGQGTRIGRLFLPRGRGGGLRLGGHTQQPLYTATMRTALALLWLTLPLWAATPEDDIRKVLEDQTAAWNRGDLPAFMAGYLESESTTFVSDTVTRGHAKVLARYLQ